jgi:dipeptidyl aminopeptidase/acylaminoacyl peptidase
MLSVIYLSICCYSCSPFSVLTNLQTHNNHTVSLQERIFYDKELEQDYEFLKANGPTNAEVGVVSRTQDESKWIVSYFQSDGPTSYAIYDKPKQNITHLFVTNPKLLEYKFAPMEDVRIPARDGLELVGYLTRPVTEGRSPLILLVHGGPWARDYWGFDARCQWFANRGYATLKVSCLAL